MMAILNEILHWTETRLPLWQRDAVRMLFQNESELTCDDYDRLYIIFKASHGLPNPQGLTPEPLQAKHLPITVQSNQKIILKTMRDLKNVNSIATERWLDFATSGMTIIFGGNGSGKSGYARVMKKACRARGQIQKIYPNANDPSAQNSIPEARFDVIVNGENKTAYWKDDSDSPNELATIAVFDSHCARAYLTSEQDVAYLPYGLDVVENLANKVLPELNKRLENEINNIDTNQQIFEHLKGETSVGQLLNTISAQTDTKKMVDLGTLSDLEKERVEELNMTLSEADPSTKAKELLLSAGRLKEFAEKASTAYIWINDIAIAKLKEIDDSCVAANQAEQVAAEILQSGEILLPGTGGLEWKALFEAARKFSTIAYPGKKFPYTDESAVCPLCQQKYEDKGERIKRFNDYIKDDVSKTAVQQRQKVDSTRIKLENTNLTFGLGKSLLEEIRHLNLNLAQELSTFQENVLSRRAWMLNALTTHSWDLKPILGDNPRQKIRNLAASQLKSARTYLKASDEKKRDLLKNEHVEFKARQNLSNCMDSLLALIERMKTKELLESCKKDLNTKSISDKSKEFASNAVTKALKNALTSEFKALGVRYIKTKIKERNEKGKIKHQLLLDLPISNRLEEILSEGEQRSIALGSFLAELKLANHSDAIVFDDPVSSLDHWWRLKVAKRLVTEATNRQVIIFTHDTTFLGQLRDEIENQKIDHAIMSLEWNGGNPGNVIEGLPWDHKSYKERIDYLEKAQRALERRPWPRYPNQTECREIRQQYDLLRATIERVIQDVAFNGVIRRFRDWVKINGLISVASLTKSDCEKISQLYQRCNDIVDAHDPASDKNDSVPTPSDLNDDIVNLKSIINQIQESRKN